MTRATTPIAPALDAGRAARARARRWLDRWRPILPLLVAEFAVWLGFGALLPIMPLYFREHGVDLVMLGLVIAAWPAARLVAEPLFGWLADRTARTPLMLAGLVVTAVATALPLVFIGPLPFLVLRGFAGLGAAAYDPAARGFIVEATTADRRGEAFGLYASSQMGGFLVGPALGGIAAALTGDPAVVFVLCAVALLGGAAAVALGVHEPAAGPSRHPRRAAPAVGIGGLPSDEPMLAVRAVRDDPARWIAPGPTPPSRLWNRLLAAAIALQLGTFYSGGTYEVVWSVYLAHLGASLGFIGLTFAAFALPVLVLSPVAGRWVDRRGMLPFLVVGAIVPAVTGIVYTLLSDPLWFLPIGLVEGAGFAILSPALFTLAAAGSPEGRASSAQGILGASGTIGTIVASATAGYLAAIDLRLPFWVFAAVMTAALAAALLVGSAAIGRLAPATSRGGVVGAGA
jgi:MFS transporter, DHA1 family, multidrug resistance protein